MQSEPNSISGLAFAGVQGTTARTAAQFAVAGTKIAYVVGSGVVVASIGPSGKLYNQRLFVANANGDTSGGNGSTSGSNTSTFALNSGYFKSPLALDNASTDPDIRRDAYGYAKNHTYICRGASAAAEIASAAQLEARNAKALNGAYSTGGSPSKLKNKVRAPTCIAISPNGRVLAVGESGYQPRVLLFSLAHDSGSQPFVAIHEHGFGIDHVKFSPNSQYICSLGTNGDNFLHVWKFSASAAVQRASNKCSHAVNDLVWHDSGSDFGDIVTVGLRFVRVWSIDARESSVSGSKVAVLRGKNPILGGLLDCNFQGIFSLSNDELLVKDRRELYLLSLKNEVSIHRASLKASTSSNGLSDGPDSVSGLVVDSPNNLVWMFDNTTKAQVYDLEELTVQQKAETPSRSVPSTPAAHSGQGSPTPSEKSRSIVTALAYGNESILILTSDAEIHLFNKKSRAFTPLILPPTTSVTGGKRTSSGELLFASRNGKITSLTDTETVSHLATHELVHAEGLTNELTAVEKHGPTVFLGDKFGSLTILDTSGDSAKPETAIKAHTSPINDIIFFQVEDTQLLCSISRDRMIQIYEKATGEWEVFCTLPTHTANLLSVKFVVPYLFVCAADRSISVHEITKKKEQEAAGPSIEINHRKTITLKNTPLAIDVSDSELVISSNDRSLSVYDKQSLELKRNIKLYSDRSFDALCVEKFLLLKHDQIVIFCGDRSLRIYNLVSGKQLACAWGHMDSILGLFEDDSCILSLGSDGCLFRWKVSSGDAISDLCADDIDEDVSLQNEDEKLIVPEAEPSPLTTKVTRKFLPTVQMSKLTISPRRAASISSDDTVCTDPESPTPRLSSATLKRMEARKKSESVSYNNAAMPTTKGGTDKLPLRSKSVSPPKIQSSTSQTPFNRTPTTIRQNTLSRSLISASKSQNPISSPHKTPSLPPPALSSGEAKERTTAYLTMIRSFVKKDAFSSDDKEAIRDEMEEILFLLGGATKTERLLQKYSEDLVEIVERKLAQKREE